MWISRPEHEVRLTKISRIEGENEFLKLDNERLQAEIRRLTDLLGMMAVRKTSTAHQPATDPFEEDPKQPDLWVSDIALDPEQLRQRIASGTTE